MRKELNENQFNALKALDDAYQATLPQTDADWELYQKLPTEQHWMQYQASKNAERNALDVLELHKHELNMKGYWVPPSGISYDRVTNHAKIL